MARAPRSFVDPVEVAQFNLEALTHKDDEADAIIKGPIKVEIKRSEVSKPSFSKKKEFVPKMFHNSTIGERERAPFHLLHVSNSHFLFKF